MKGGDGLVGRLGGRSGFYRMNQQSMRELCKSFLRSLGQVKGRAKIEISATSEVMDLSVANLLIFGASNS
jgi:hypothetical protein